MCNEDLCCYSSCYVVTVAVLDQRLSQGFYAGILFPKIIILNEPRDGGRTAGTME